MGDALRANAERLLGDVQTVHRRMLAEIDREERALGLRSGAADRGAQRSAPRESGGSVRRPADDELDVPEFIPPG
jgi:hypothetical protein